MPDLTGMYDTAITVSVILAGVAALILVAALIALLYLVIPRLEQFHPYAPWIVGSVTVAFCLFVLAVGASLILTLLTGKNLLVIRNPHGLLLGLISVLHRLGKKFGISADRVSNSLLKLNNALILATTRFSGDERILLLLPRCLTKEIRLEILQMAKNRGLKHAVCAGGEDARKKILTEQPHVVVAVACERDLIAGIRDIQNRIPVIGVPNSRPKGPCKCTEINIKSLVSIISRIMAPSASLDTANAE